MLAGGIKAAAKRTAFGDVSNTARNLGNVQDDSAVPSKNNIHEIVKTLQPAEKLTALSRPAQRPLNAAPLKGALNNISVSDNNSFQPKVSVADVRQNAPAKQATAKRGPTIFKDDDVNQENLLPVLPQNKQLPLPPIDAVPNLTRQSAAPGPGGPCHLSLMKPTQGPLPQQQEKVEENKIKSDVAVTVHPEPLIQSVEVYAPVPEVEVKAAGFPLVQDNLQSVTSLPGFDRRSLPPPPNCSDPEERQEQEEEEYDEDYATAHSFRSRGDNTTGGMTMIMAPNVTNRVRQELEDAKILVTAARTPEEIEDEQWDTSMVAEYGDEIFSYMRELEVIFSPFNFLSFVLRTTSRVPELRAWVRPCRSL